MRYSNLFGKTKKEAPKDEVSINAKLLIRAGFIEKLAAGVYNFLPLGWRVHEKIGQIIREEMNVIGGQELNLAALHPKSVWEKSGRWDKFGALYKLKNQSGEDLALGATHEEVLTPIISHYISSYKDLPLYLYQIQVKFRDEPRAKSGILRCREFVMKDLYSFHATEEDRASYYERVRKTYEKIFKRFGLQAIYTKASGGSFSEFSHEFQVITDAGEDEIIYCPEGDFSENVDITKVKEGKECDMGHGPLKRAKVIEVGNIFPLGTRFSEAFGAYFTDEKGDKKPIVMGSYGIGLGRNMGTIVEVHHDDKGIIWPESVAPYEVHLVGLSEKADEVYKQLKDTGIDVLYDDRDVSAGEKFATADLIGIPYRLVVSQKTGNKIEVKKRDSEKTEDLEFDSLLGLLKEERED
ncbi:MAG: Prolyl-tRNA synthetase [Candidatus Levybacteria bacterium GW2011_GWA2_40_8]|nr:MAG: Prolyl-tRNA synthetase [Candidatus Levybacteria bacterium GW2011_GWA2_40_8]